MGASSGPSAAGASPVACLEPHLRQNKVGSNPQGWWDNNDRISMATCHILGKSKRGLTNGGLSPKFSEKIGGKSFLGNRAFSGLIGAFSGPVGAFSGPIGTNYSAPHSHGGRAEIAPKGPFLAQLAPFGPSPPLLSPPLDFPEYRTTAQQL